MAIRICLECGERFDDWGESDRLYCDICEEK